MVKAVAERLEKNKVSLEIVVEAEKVDAALDRAYRKVARQVNVPGFRKGKVPRSVIEMRYGKEVLYEEALDELIPQAFQEAVTQTEVEPIDQPTVTHVDIEAGKPLRFTAVVDVTPDVELGEYKGLKVEKIVEQVDDHDIDHMLWHLQEDHAQLAATDRTTVESGDFVQIDFEGLIDGVPFPGGAAKGYILEIGSGRFIPGFEDQLIGAEVDKEVEVNVTFPEDYGNDLAGQDALFKVTVTSIKVKEVPELNDEFASMVSDVETLDELKAKIREDMEKAAEQRADREMREKLIEMVSEGSNVDIPEIMIQREIDDIIEDFTRDLAFRRMTLDEYLAETGKTKEELEEEVKPGATDRVKSRLVLAALAKREGITVDEDELEAKISELIAESRNQDSMRKMMSDPDRRRAFKSSLIMDKTIDFLVAQAEIEEKQKPSEGHGHHHG